jgi:hypothetical protein
LEDGRDEGERRSLSLGRRSGNSNNSHQHEGSGSSTTRRHYGEHQHGDENDGSRSSWGDNEEERDRLLLHSGGVNANANANRPAARRVHSAYAGAAARCGGASTAVSSRMVALVALCGLVLILWNAMVNVRVATTHQQGLDILVMGVVRSSRPFLHPTEPSNCALAQDYQGELMDKLRKGGTPPEEIERMFPKSFQEKRQTVLDDHKLLESLHGAVAALRVEVDEIKERLDAAAADKAAKGSSTAAATVGADPQGRPHPPPAPKR